MNVWNCDNKSIIEINFKNGGIKELQESNLIKNNSIYKDKKDNGIKVIGLYENNDSNDNYILFTTLSTCNDKFIKLLGQNPDIKNEIEYKYVCSIEFFLSLNLDFVFCLNDIYVPYDRLVVEHLTYSDFFKSLIIKEKEYITMTEGSIPNMLYGYFIKKLSSLNISITNNYTSETNSRIEKRDQVFINKNNLLYKLSFNDAEILGDLLADFNLDFEEEFDNIIEKYPFIKELYEIYKKNESNLEPYDAFDFKMDLENTGHFLQFENKDCNEYKKNKENNVIFHLFKVVGHENNNNANQISLVKIYGDELIYVDLEELVGGL